MILSQRRFSLPSGFSFEAIVLGCYLVRDAFGGVMRYYTNVLHVDALWFTPDLLAMLCLVQFVRHCIIRNGSTLPRWCCCRSCCRWCSVTSCLAPSMHCLHRSR